MHTLVQLTQLLISSFVISDPDRRDLTTSHGVPAHALKELVDSEKLPKWAIDMLHFTKGQSGLICVEWPQIEEIARDLGFTSEPNPTFKRTEVKVSLSVAEREIWKLNFDEDEAKSLGNAFRYAIISCENKLEVA